MKKTSFCKNAWHWFCVWQFQDTASLETVMLGSSVQTVEANAFANCANLKTAYISDEVKKIDSTAFDGCENLMIAVPTETCYAYSYAVQNNIPVTTLQISPIANQTYTGASIEPEFTVKASGKQLTKNVDYEAYFKNNTEAGQATVIVTGIGNFTGTKTLTFEIVDAPPTTEVPVTPGDIDGDGEITMSDYAMVRSAALGILEITDSAAYRAADAFDAAEIDLLLHGFKRQST